VLPYETGEVLKTVAVDQHGFALFEAVRQQKRRGAGQSAPSSHREAFEIREYCPGRGSPGHC
jgi:hypothetical protein